MTLGELLRQLCAQTILIVSLPVDLPLPQPDDLCIPIAMPASVTPSPKPPLLLACPFMARAPSENGWRNFARVGQRGLPMKTPSCDWMASSGQAAYGNPKEVIRLYLLPSWDVLAEHLPQIQCGVAAAFAEAQRWGED